MIEDGLEALITADIRFSSIAGTRLYPVVLPDTLLDVNTQTPTSATYQVITAIPEYTNDGPTGMVKARIQIDTWAETYAECKALADAIRRIIDGYTGALPDGTPVQNTWRDNATDGFDPDSRLFRSQTDYRVIYTE